MEVSTHVADGLELHGRRVWVVDGWHAVQDGGDGGVLGDQQHVDSTAYGSRTGGAERWVC